MILVFFYAYVLLSCLPVLHSAITNSTSMPNCPESFSCPGIAPLKYPFYNVTDTQCGLIRVNCTSTGGTVQLDQGRRYEIAGKYDLVQYPDFQNIIIHNQTFEHLLNNRSCEALNNNFTSPTPLLYYTFIYPFITLFKCKTNLTSVQQTYAYFMQRNYSSYNSCKDYTFYYNYLNATVPSHRPHTCQVAYLPAKLSSTPGFDETSIFSLLSSSTSIFFNLSNSCNKCHKKGNRCDTKNGKFQCSEATKEKPSGEKATIPDKTAENHRREYTKLKILVIAGSTMILMPIFIIFIIWCHRKRNPFSYVPSKNASQNLEDISPSCGVSVFSYKELEDATQNFDPSNELGDGGFGAVYYGKLQDGREVAVKKLHEHNYKRVQQFINEVEILTKLRHPNLVVLYGCTSSQSRELLLVYEYVPNGTVADHLHGEQATPNLLPWHVRMNIAIETASALAYLHASEIIHRDVKTNNILLDLNFSVKVADFGLSRIISNNLTHVSTAPQGTPGYVDPQYHTRYQLTDKSDVYSFGVVLIELISSMLAVDLNRDQDEISLANLALNRIQKCAIDELIDPALVSDANPEIRNTITLVAELAFRCLQYEAEMRPTMNEVVDALKDIHSVGRIGSSENVNLLPLPETNDAVILLKDFQRSPVSVTDEWQSSNSVSTTISSNGDRLSVKNSSIR